MLLRFRSNIDGERESETQSFYYFGRFGYSSDSSSESRFGAWEKFNKFSFKLKVFKFIIVFTRLSRFYLEIYQAFLTN